ncbi:type II toxin-antitoxin system PemK/MazF family toxin [Sphingomonas glaciei]|uniref:Type II toxin-antitoxin system PemK/MazF family toxin n=1 Tax=Sphingomonas glaciei TaxID=2938948 RepID=A0ABY5MTI4_9SPHN|nr:type II toxin-antitoxin system PemK/MazF family toxin [Sphingomonas glaciei]UUR07493.1 type II toxin-antitoxin system PemK/MazF family toxin [Sphingomonas glaciei]
MPLTFPAAPRTILLCDYSMGGFRPPEMVKRRPAVVITGRLPRRNNLHTVVPLSGTPSDERNLYHCKIELTAPLPEPFAETTWWVKADMIATVSLERLDLFRTGRDQHGRRKYLNDLRVSEEHFATIKVAVGHALGLTLDK